MPGKQEIVKAFFENWKAQRKTDDYSWADELVDDIVRADAVEGWLLTLDLIAAAPCKQSLAYVAAGPLEDLLKSHGGAVRDLLLSNIADNKRLQFAVACTWMNEDDEIYPAILTINEQFSLDDLDPIDKLPWSDEPWERSD